MAMNPLYNPAVPVNVSVSLSTGSMIYVTGQPAGNRFSINLKCGPGPNANNAFHFNPRFDGFTVVRNTMRNNMWEAEERMATGFPFQQGRAFEVIILCEQQQYKVAVNGEHFITFAHRIPLSNVRHLCIQGNVVVHMVKFDREAGSGIPKTVYNPVTPYKMPVPFNNIKGRSITIKGIPQNRDPHRMMLAFQTDSDPPELFFQFAPRFNEGVIVRNSKMNGSWAKEERALPIPFPFQYGVPFAIVVSVDQQCFRVELNGMVICTFAHRNRPLTRIRYVNIGGSVDVTEMSFT